LPEDDKSVASLGRMTSCSQSFPAVKKEHSANQKKRYFMKRVTLNAPGDIGCLITFLPSLIRSLVISS
jgi:hypothetical protein